MKIPGTINQGDTVTWIDGPATDSLGNAITSPGYTLTWYFAGPTTLSVVSTAANGGWQTTLTSAQTTAFVVDPDAAYYWQALASNGTSKFTLGTGTFTVIPTIAGQQAGFDGRTQDEKDLAAVKAALQARYTGGAVAEYTIGTRRLRYESMESLQNMYQILLVRVLKAQRAQMMANGLGDPLNTYVGFTRG